MLAIGFLAVAAYLALIAVTSPILVRMAFRNVIRRPGRSVLIVVGLMLGTAIISASFTTGDSVTFSIKQRVVELLQGADELIRLDEDSDVWDGRSFPADFPESVFDEVAPALDASPDLDAVLPIVRQDTAVINFRAQQFEVQALYLGLDPARAAVFETLRDLQGNPIDLASLGPDEVYIDREGAERIEAQPGDALGVVTGPGGLTQVMVKGITEGWYVKTSGDTRLVLMAPLAQVQEHLDKEGRLTHVVLSNSGDYLEGLDLTDDVIDAFGDFPALTESGLEIYDFKRRAVDTANQVGSLFVSMFTTFGLFSIGAGILLIFLIFSMLSAERRSEMGMARAVGMRRSHLVRQFVAEGAIYGLGSTAIGALAGIGLGYVLIVATGSAFSGDSTTDLVFVAHVELRSVLASFLVGSMVTFVTILLAARQNSRLNIVRAVRGISRAAGGRREADADLGSRCPADRSAHRVLRLPVRPVDGLWAWNVLHTNRHRADSKVAGCGSAMGADRGGRISPCLLVAARQRLRRTSRRLEAGPVRLLCLRRDGRRRRRAGHRQQLVDNPGPPDRHFGQGETVHSNRQVGCRVPAALRVQDWVVGGHVRGGGFFGRGDVRPR